jgi:RNA polymerase II-associated protein 3
MAILYSNRAMAYIKLAEYLKAKEDCDEALKHDDTYIKSYVRRGRALHKLNKLREALSDLRLANDLEKGNKEVEDEINQLNKKIQNAKKDGKNKMVNFVKFLYFRCLIYLQLIKISTLSR